MSNGKRKKYWRGFNELKNTDEFKSALKAEMTKDTDTEKVSPPMVLSRRKFLTLVGATAAITAAGCANYRDKGKIIPYNKKPEDITIGIPNYYASTCTGCSEACGILIKTREGRPIKVDGNPDHPVNAGKICSRGQSSILNLYEPDRLKEPFSGDTSGSYSPVKWQTADDKIAAALNSAVQSGKEIALISHTITSPFYKKIINDFIDKYKTAKLYVYELAGENNFINGWKKSYNIQSNDFTIPSVNLKDAKIILSLESDILGTEKNRQENIRHFSKSRELVIKEKLNRLYCVEGGVSVTGMNADFRIRMKSDLIEEFALCIANELSNKSAIKFDLSKYNLGDFVKKNNLDKEVVEKLVSDLSENIGTAYVTAGLQMPESTHAAVNLLNDILGITKLYNYGNSFQWQVMPSSSDELDQLAAKMQAGNVAVAIHLDTNPVFHFSPDYNYQDLLKKVNTKITLTEFINETTDLSNFVLPLSHNYESWGDHKIRTGVYSLQQPVIMPIYDTRQKEAILLNWITGDLKDVTSDVYALNYLKDFCEKNIYPATGARTSFKDFWINALHDGVISFSEKVSEKPNFAADAVSNFGKIKESKEFTVLLNRSHFIGDGRYAGNGWLMELPHPISKIVWDNYAAISSQSAKSLGIDSNDLIEIRAGGKKIVAAAFIQPGLADNQITIELGYGRKKAGDVGTGWGFDASELISKNPAISQWLYNDGKVSKAGGSYELVSTQEHYPIDQELYKDIQFKRGIIRETTLEKYRKEPDDIIEKKTVDGLNVLEYPSVNEPHKYTGVKWAMSIDLNKCIGCSDCISGCNVENNIPVVGKEQVKANREMHWIRIDRYYSGTTKEPRANFMPMLCQHCDNAPCENVCPVGATTHSEDGINGMAYNRCVGTRYCSNNCPYKVRRYNYFNFRDRFAKGHYEKEPLEQMMNPEVTVRSRGVMEKCTFCVQLTMKERQDAIADGREILGSNVKTACQEACPASAIEFGDMNKKDSDLQKYRNHKLAYYVLEEIKVKPNVTYLAKVRNV